MSVFTQITRGCLFFVGSVLLLIGIFALVNFPKEKATAVRRLATLKEAFQIVERQRLNERWIPQEVKLLADTGGGDVREVRIAVLTWQPINWSNPLVGGGSNVKPHEQKYRLWYSTANSDSADILDSTTERTSLDKAPSLLIRLTVCFVLLFLGFGSFYIAKCLNPDAL